MFAKDYTKYVFSQNILRLQCPPERSLDDDAEESIQAAADGLSLLDAIDLDPVRRAIAAASIKP